MRTESRRLSGFSTRVFHRQDIRGYRRVGQTSNIRLVPVDSEQKSMTVPADLLSRDDTPAWLLNIPDLDEEDLRAAEKVLEEDANLGATPEERQKRIANLRRIAKYSSWLAYAVAGWAWFWPKPYLWAVGAAIVLPFVGVALIFLLRRVHAAGVENDKMDARPSLGELFMLPAFVLTMRAFSDLNVLDWMALLFWSVGLGVAGTIFVAMRSEMVRSKPLHLISPFILCMAYFYGALAGSNTMLNKSRLKKFPTDAARLARRRVTSAYPPTATQHSPAARSSSVSTQERKRTRRTASTSAHRQNCQMQLRAFLRGR